MDLVLRSLYELFWIVKVVVT